MPRILALLIALPAAAALAQSLPVTELRAGMHLIHAEVAADFSTRARGLMHRKGLAPNAGMLFIFDAPSEQCMWMKNTYIPLDMVFIDGDGRIQQIVEQTTPHSLAIISSREPALAVLEIGGGEAKRLGLHPGQRVLHAALVGYHP